MAPRDDADVEAAVEEMRRLDRLRRPSAEGDDQDLWLISYSDLITLLFAVFVMLLAITMKSQVPVEHGASALPLPADAIGPGEAPADPRPRLEPDQVPVEAPEPLTERWRQRLASLGVAAGVTVHVRQNRVEIDIGEAILFASGQAEPSADGRAVLADLAPLLAGAPGLIVVEGHTDSVPIASVRFPSNWELSAARAAGVVRELVVLGVPPQRMSAVGYADTRPRALADDAVARARNRRVTVTLQADALAGDRAPEPVSQISGGRGP